MQIMRSSQPCRRRPLSEVWHLDRRPGHGARGGAADLAERNVGLKEAKDAVEELAQGHGIAATRGGCAGVLLLLVTVGVLIATL